MIETIIIGKRSNLSQVLIKNIDNAKVFSLKQILHKKNKILSQKEKINIIYNHSYPLFKLDNTTNIFEILDANVSHINIFLNLLLKKKTRINNFIYSSSSAVYGINSNDHNIHSNKILYGASKLIVEKLLFLQCKMLKCNLIISRIFNIYGLQEKSSLISKIINKKKVRINKFNDSYRDFIHIDDVSKIYKKLLKNKKKFLITDIGTGKVTSVNKLIKKYVTKNKKIISNIKKKKEIAYSKANTMVLKKIMNKFKYTNINDFLNENLRNQ
jgi:nucleoside-diphosphate-sugar epimerase